MKLVLTGYCDVPAEPMVLWLAQKIIGAGGWVWEHNCSKDDFRAARIHFEFVRYAGPDIYALLLAAGVVLCQDSYLQLLILCDCTNHFRRCAGFGMVELEMVTIELLLRKESAVGAVRNRFAS